MASSFSPRVESYVSVYLLKVRYYYIKKDVVEECG